MKLERSLARFALEASWWPDSQNPVWYWRPLEGNLNSQELCEQHDGGGAIKPRRSSCCVQHLVQKLFQLPYPIPHF